MSIYRFPSLLLILTLTATITFIPQAYAADSSEPDSVLDTIDWTVPSGCKQVYGFNYQPSFGSTGVEIWIDKFNADTVDHELGLGRQYFPEMNTVRLWLSPDAYIKNPEQFVQNFEATLASCEKYNIKAIPTLFNNWHSVPDFGGISEEMINYWFHNYGQEGEAANYVFRPYLEAMFKDHATDDRILAWDLCNEPFNNGSAGTYVPWLQHTYNLAKTLGAEQPIGVSVAFSIGQLQLVESCSDVLMIHPYFAANNDWNALKTFADEHDKALLATETCWGSLDDAARVSIVRSDLGTLKSNDVGFVVHALHESYVADLHHTEYGPVSSAGYMAFINMDGSLRAGHEVFNEFTQAAQPDPVWPVDPGIVIDDQAGTAAGTGFSLTGAWGTGTGVAAIGGGYSWPPADPTEATATYTPGDVAGFKSGTYDVYVSWGVYWEHTGTTYTVNHVNGAEVFHFDNKDNASQGSAGGLNPNTGGSGSGFYFLGTFELDSASKVVHSGPGSVDAVMFRTTEDGRYLDHQSANLVAGNPTAWMMAPAITVPSGNYFYSTENTTVTWTDLVDEAGNYDVKVSWGVHPAHSDNVKYLVDINGNGQQDEEDALITVNQMLMADQATGGSAVWSHYFSLGSFTLTADSQVLQWNGHSNYVAMTIAPMLVTPISVPEPNTLGLLMTFGIFVYCFRVGKSARR